MFIFHILYFWCHSYKCEVAMKESTFQAKLIKRLKASYPDSDILKNDANYRQGYPDLTVRIGGECFMLECKASATASQRPNQQYYVDRINDTGGFARFIYPENEEEVLDEIQRSLSHCGKAFVPKS